jgi:CubicO group peptidase (beta-lactamase class C family)
MSEHCQTRFEELCAFVQERMKAAGVPGVSIGILQGEEMHTAGFGITHAEQPVPVTDETLFQIGSITKTATCLVLMRLVEQGELDLRAPVQTYLPEFRVADEAVSAQVTTWHLLTHMSGWDGDLFEDTGSGDDALPRYMAKMADLEQLAPLGTVWSYNNAGFSLAGYIIEQITGLPYEKAMQNLVLEPLGLKRCFFVPGDVITHRFVVGHQVEEGHPVVLRPWPLPRAAYPAGGLVCDVKSLLAYAQFQMGDGSTGVGEEWVQVVKQETMDQMHRPQASIWGDEAQIGLAWFIDQVQGVRQLSHGGGTTGQISLLAMYPEHRLALAVLTNADEGSAVTDAARRWVMEHYLEVREPKPEPIESKEEELAAAVGFYTRPFADVEIGLLCGRLVGQVIYKRGFPSREVPPPPPPPPSALALCEKDRLLVIGGPGEGGRVDIIRKPDGSIGWLRMGRIYRRVDK